jgi:anhydro-N-acetylmuramic acid kinase
VSKLTTAIGLMSGTSLDGIDVALIRTDGEDIVERGPSKTIIYSEDQRKMLHAALREAKSLISRNELPPQLLSTETGLTKLHELAVKEFFEEHGLKRTDIDVIGFHGQTVIHRPKLKLTVQLGDGWSLAKRLGIPVVYDLRAADVQAGGQGAPLAPVYHQALAAAFPERPLAFVNIGGVANMTWIGGNGEIAAFDTGPGNALLNDWCEKHTGKPMDRNGELAAKGKVDKKVLAKFASHPYFDQTYPKSLDRDAFAVSVLRGLSLEDGAATLTHFTATSIARGVQHMPARPKLYIIVGGGRHNQTMMREIRALFEPLGEKVMSAEEAGLNGDSIEAEAWAYLAVRSMKSSPITFPGTTGVPLPLTGGVLALP